MIRKETIAEGVDLYLGDSREILPALGTIHAVVSDPPYGIGYVKGAGGKRVAGSRLPPRRNIEAITGDDTPFDPSFLLSCQETMLFGADHFRNKLPDWGRFLCWNKLAHSTIEDSFSDAEFIWHSEGGASRIISYLWKGVQQAGEKGLQRVHPTQKPVAVMRWCISQLRFQNLPIVDPFMGSGTTGVAALKEGRKFVGIEIDPKYFDIACTRVQSAYDAPDMFVANPKVAKQETFEL